MATKKAAKPAAPKKAGGKKKGAKPTAKKSNRPENFSSDKEWHDSVMGAQAWERGEAVECATDTSK